MDQAQQTDQPVVEVRNLGKRFTGVVALDDVSLAFYPGQVHALIGENGAGKSTFMNLLAGVLEPTRGAIYIDGQPAQLRRPIDAMRRGVVMIHQELNLVDELSVADNLLLGQELTRGGLIDRRATHNKARQLLAQVGAEAIDPATPVKRLSVAQMQMIEIAKALAGEARLLILDEPTAVLSRREAALLFDLVGRLRSRGVAIVYISHLLPEVLGLADRITVLRDGQHVTTLDEAQVKQADENQLASLMVGRPMADHFPPRGEHGQDVVLKVENLGDGRQVRGVGFELRQGEILGFAGLIGAGRTEMAEMIVGLRPRTSGQVSLDGQPMNIRNVRDAMKAGIAYLSEDRKGTGLVLDLGITENTTLASLSRYCRPLLSRKAEDAAAAEQARALRTKAGNLRDPVRTLSGGNQQKVALAKWLEIQPRVLILDEPTRGVDIGAKEEIYRLIQGLTRQGMSCVVISSELNELIGLCHRIAVMRQGGVVATVEAEDATEQRLMRHAAGVKQAERPEQEVAT